MVALFGHTLLVILNIAITTANNASILCNTLSPACHYLLSSYCTNSLSFRCLIALESKPFSWVPLNYVDPGSLFLEVIFLSLHTLEEDYLALVSLFLPIILRIIISQSIDNYRQSDYRKGVFYPVLLAV